MPYFDYNKGRIVQVWSGINGAIFHSEKLTFGHFTLDEGTDLPEHSHPHEQWTHLIEGILEFFIGDEKMIMNPGICAYIPPNVPHSGRAITKCKVIDCFMPVREDFIELEKKQYAV